MARVNYGDPRGAAHVSFDEAEGMFRVAIRGASLVMRPGEIACLRDSLMQVDRLPAYVALAAALPPVTTDVRSAG